MRQLTIAQKLALLLGGITLILLIIAFTSVRTMNTVKIGGRYYSDIIDGKDLTADILPPPGFLVELHMTCYQMASGSITAADFKSAASRMIAESHSTYAKWEKLEADADVTMELRKQFLGPTKKSADSYIDAVEKQFIPAIGGNPDQLKELMRTVLNPLFMAHRAEIVKSVALANSWAVNIQGVAENAVGTGRFKLILALVVGIIAAIGLGVMIARDITRPINKTTAMLKNISEGEGDLTQRLAIDSRDEIGELARYFNKFIEGQQLIIARVKDVFTVVNQSADTIFTATESLAAGAEEQQAQLSEVAASVEEMSAMVLQTSNSAGNTDQNTNEAAAVAREGGKTIQDTVDGIRDIVAIVESASRQINELEAQSQSIGEVIQVIDDIADQTNLLALNANIEAARAGDAGRGFAVVADEVRKLAERTVRATGEISSKIEHIQQDIRGSVQAMLQIKEQSQKGQKSANKSGTVLKEIVESIQAVRGAMSQIAAAAEEQSAGAEEISKNVESISTVSRDAATSAQELAASADKLKKEVAELDVLIRRLKVD